MKMTRRDLAKAAAGSAVALQTKPLTAAYRTALDGFEGKVDMKTFDPVHYSLGLYEAAPLQLTYREGTRKQAEAWQKKLRAKVTELIGGFPSTRSPLKPQTLEKREFTRYTREKVAFESRPGMGVLAYLLTPKQGKAPFATMVCVPGHGRGVEAIVGVDNKGQDNDRKEGYQHDFAIQVAEAGMAAVAIEPIAFGCRRDERTIRKGLDASACQPVAGAALLLGQTMAGWRTYDVMRTLDWVETRAELDKTRVGCMGISGGGTITTFATALEPRIRVALISGYLNTFRDSIFSLSHCIDNYVPGILNWAEMYDVASLIAPRPLFIEAGEKDDIFPLAAVKESYAKVQRVYKVFDAEDKLGLETFDAGHSFSGVKGISFLAKMLA